MKENSIKIVMIVFLAFFALTLLISMIFLLSGNHSIFSFFHGKGDTKVILNETYSEDMLDKITKIVVDAPISDIKVLENNTSKDIKILVYGEEEEKADATLEGNTLRIINQKRTKFCFGFCFTKKEEVFVYIPKDKIKEMELSSVSGDIFVSSEPQARVIARSTSGDIKVETVEHATLRSVSGDLSIHSFIDGALETVSGDIHVEKGREQMDVKTTSGDVQIIEFLGNMDSHIKTISGDVTIEKIGSIYVDAHTKSGFVSIDSSSRESTTRLTIESVSGDIHVK